MEHFARASQAVVCAAQEVILVAVARAGMHTIEFQTFNRLKRAAHAPLGGR